MKTFLLILALAASPAIAQGFDHGADNNTNLLGKPTARAIFALSSSTGALATISKDGEVKIDWDAVEKAANNPDTTNAHTLAIARLMIAIVYGTWKPMK